MNYKEREIQNRKRLTEAFGDITENSGIYVFVRYEGGFKYGYGGQAKHLQTRIAQHLDGYDSHIDLSIKKHGLYNKETCPHGWRVLWAEVPIEYLDEVKRHTYRRLHHKAIKCLTRRVADKARENTELHPTSRQKAIEMA